ncbi:hypothetical protein EDC18_103168 [Natranaerovirga pectinivora]|uniref:DUF4878 domain-containing protein n=1 Tax=Natranaerovirga pectinivora TaxID=682400 RepID=A0A4R3MME3_9FIRM|nr:hypothetical protein [Natranaerovirga pectinivora]TCT15463.1 hypothetical protein EDC18_103168 [Natranaerovirga pectinivora]
MGNLKKTIKIFGLSLGILSMILLVGCNETEVEQEREYAISEELRTTTPKLTVEQWIEAIFLVDAEYYLETYSDRAIFELQQDYVYWGYNEDYATLAEYVEKGALPLFKQDLLQAGKTQVSDFVIEEPEDYLDKEEVDVTIDFGDGIGVLPLIKQDGKWLIKGFGVYEDDIQNQINN